MTPPSCWPDRHVPIVMDASAVINLNGTGVAIEILSALRHDMVVAEEVIYELEDGTRNGRSDAARLEELIAAGLVRRALLGEAGKPIFEQLTIGSSVETLEDGEAATIALAVELSGVAIVDESKGRRICGLRQLNVPLITSVEMLAHPDTRADLGDRLADAVFAALTQARMQVLPQYQGWVIELLGGERAALCTSLPRRLRGS